MVKKYIPVRGDVVWVDFDPVEGHEQGGRRPAIVISPEAYNKISKRALFCPITSKKRGFIFEVPCVLAKIDGVVLVDQVRTLDWGARKITFIERCLKVVVDEVEAKLRTLIHE